MAVMGRRKQAVGRMWTLKQLENQESNHPQEKESEEISEDEHKERLKLLKNIGLI